MNEKTKISFARRNPSREAVAGLDEASLAEVLELSGRKLQDFPQDKECVVDVKMNGTAKEKRQLSHLINEMCKSEYGKQVIETAKKNDYTFQFDLSIPDAYGFADPDGKVCAMNPTFSTDDLISTMAHELRHVYQFSFPVCDRCNPLEADAKSNLMLTRTMEADASAYECLTSWDLKEKGIAGAWNNFSRDFPEIAKPFEKAMIENEGKPDQIAKARTAAFDGWFDNLPRRVGYDESYLDCLKENGPKSLSSSLKAFGADEMIGAFCQENGVSYYLDDPKKFESGYLVATSQKNKDDLKKFFSSYNRLSGNAKESSLQEIPALEKMELPASVARSLPAKAAAIEAKQEHAKAVIVKNRAAKPSPAFIRFAADRSR